MSDADEDAHVPTSTNEDEKPKNKRSRAAPMSFDPDTDPTCVAILKFLNASPAPSISRASTVDIDGKPVSVGTKMYTLRLQARDTESCTPLMTQRLAYLASNERWADFVNNNINARSKKAHAGAATTTTTTTTTTTRTPKPPLLQQPIHPMPEQDAMEEEQEEQEEQSAKRARTQDLQADASRLSSQCLHLQYQIARIKEQHLQLLLTLYKCFPNMKPLITNHMIETSQTTI